MRADLDPLNLTAEQVRPELSDYGFNFGQLGHEESPGEVYKPTVPIISETVLVNYSGWAGPSHRNAADSSCVEKETGRDRRPETISRVSTPA